MNIFNRMNFTQEVMFEEILTKMLVLSTEYFSLEIKYLVRREKYLIIIFSDKLEKHKQTKWENEKEDNIKEAH